LVRRFAKTFFANKNGVDDTCVNNEKSYPVVRLPQNVKLESKEHPVEEHIQPELPPHNNNNTCKTQSFFCSKATEQKDSHSCTPTKTTNQLQTQSTMPGGPIFNAFTKAASFTARGAAVTFGSTILSCMAACKIEQGANRLIYEYFPHKFADVEWANGLTQEQLDAVRVYRVTPTASEEETRITSEESEPHVTATATLFTTEHALHQVAEQPTDPLLLHRRPHEEEADRATKTKKTRDEETNFTKTRFWKEGEEALTALIPAAVLPRQEILACAMTC
jgi:hypothetical protein